MRSAVGDEWYRRPVLSAVGCGRPAADSGREQSWSTVIPPDLLIAANSPGLGSNVALTISKGLAGLWFNSASLLAEAGHSLSDLLGVSIRPPHTWAC